MVLVSLFIAFGTAVVSYCIFQRVSIFRYTMDMPRNQVLGGSGVVNLFIYHHDMQSVEVVEIH